MQQSPDPDDHIAALVIRNVEGASALFAHLLTTDRPLPIAVAGLNQLTNAAAAMPDLSGIAATLAASLAANIEAAAPIVAAEAAPAVSPEEVYFAMGCAAALLGKELSFQRDRIAFARILGAKLDLAVQRNGLRERGDPLMRAVRIQRALSAQPDLPHLM